MKKINLFNKTISPLSDGKGCPVERGGVWELPRRTPCATPSWKEGERKVPSFRGTGPHKNVQHFCGWFHAESPRCCRELVCGKTDGIPLFSGMTVRICGMMIAIAALFATPSFAEPTELDKKTVASKAYVDTKQDIIETGSMTFNVPEAGSDYTVSNMLIFSGGNGITGTQIGLIDSSDILAIYEDLGATDYDIRDLRGSGVSDATLSRLVPTVKALSDALTPLSWDSTKDTKAIIAYNATFGSGTNNWAGSWVDLINGQFLASSLYLKQNKIATSGKYYNASGTLASYNENSSNVSTSWLHTSVKGTGLVTKTATEGRVGERKIFEASDVSNYHAANLNQNQQDIQDISIPTVGAVMSIVSTNAPTGTPGNVAMYDATTGALGDGVATYDGSTTYNASTDADKIAVMSGVQRKKECGGYEPAPAGQPAHDGTHPGDEDYCWLWIFPD